MIDDIYIEAFTGKEPYATGDAKSHRWGTTNFGLYGSSFVGIFGGIIEKTDVEGILKLNLLATDYFHDEAYPTFLYYNPYDIDQQVTVNVGDKSDIYDKVQQSFIAREATGQTRINIAADSARVLVIVPSGGLAVAQDGKLIVNNKIIDFRHEGLN